MLVPVTTATSGNRTSTHMMPSKANSNRSAVPRRRGRTSRGTDSSTVKSCGSSECDPEATKVRSRICVGIALFIVRVVDEKQIIDLGGWSVMIGRISITRADSTRSTNMLLRIEREYEFGICEIEVFQLDSQIGMAFVEGSYDVIRLILRHIV